MSPALVRRLPATLRSTVLVVAAAACAARADLKLAEPGYELTGEDHALLEEISRAAFRFFEEQAHPRTGLVRDRARADGSASEGKASIAASGFALSGWAIATERGWVSRDEALRRVRHMVRFLAEEAPRRHGFFYHFMEMDTGARAWRCEVSSIDSSLLFAGAIVAREYFGDPEITALVNALLADIDWEWFRNGGDLVSLAWYDETGFSRYRWNRYSEHILMSFLALGTSPRPVESGYWNRWERGPAGRYADYTYLQEPPLFVHQFPLAYLDLRDRRDAFVDYFHNSRLATLAQRRFSQDVQPEFPAWGENLWGVTASDSVTGYKAWGGPPRTQGFNALDGTIVPCAAAGSLPFAPRETLAVLHHLRTAYGDRLWGRYGFADAFNPHTGWVNPDVIGIDLGITLLQAENLRSGLVWRLFMQSPEARLGLVKAGILRHARTLDRAAQQELRQRAAAAWRILESATASPGLQLTALVAAHRLGLLDVDALVAAARHQLVTRPDPTTTDEAGQWAAALITLRQAEPSLADDATRRLTAIRWDSLPAADRLAGTARLAAFLQVAAGLRPAAAWAELERATERLGPVHVLAPVDVAGALLPGLWLDESGLLSGASASQLAYATLTGAANPRDDLLPVLQLAHFPAEALARPAPAATSPAAAAASLVTIANLLADDAVRRAFQQDLLVQAGRAAIAEFQAAPFGPNTSIIAQGPLSGHVPPAPRETLGVARSRARDSWDWQLVSGPEFLDTGADQRPGDPPLTLRFAFTWDETALHFHAEVTDSPAGYTLPAERRRMVELFLDPAGDGLVWAGSGDHQFTYDVRDDARVSSRRARGPFRLQPTPHGYTLEAAIPWDAIGVTPRPGLRLGASPAVVAAGRHDWEASTKLNWSFHPLGAGVYRLGVVRLE